MCVGPATDNCERRPNRRGRKQIIAISILMFGDLFEPGKPNGKTKNYRPIVVSYYENR